VNIKILASFMLAFSFVAVADPTFKSVTYYEALGDRFRVETAQAWPKCVARASARKVFLDKTNELREVFYWDEKGKQHGAGKSNNPEVHKKVNEIFAATQIESANPCIAPEPSDKASNAVLQ
jgi:hypothetical protein